ncbi:MAG: K(+)-transporting ATPase subunit F [Phreatobacter sp.]|nr:K(+)-transporting ATPase subunit F [Phreatobacter sp.]MDP2800913.1 K(+)-transporting ATPase subunit F [Phreatobacter sp.]
MPLGLTLDIALGLTLAAGLFVYLVAALLAPERF